GAIVQAPSPALVVPAASLVVRDGRSLVFELQSAGPRSTVGAREVRIGRRLATEVEIVEGLAAGARLGARGAGLLADGDVVEIVGGLAAGARLGGGGEGLFAVGDVVEIVASAAAPNEGPPSHAWIGAEQR